jgi:cystathionine beta-lyase/cystathionine gamma-synthase
MNTAPTKSQVFRQGEAIGGDHAITGTLPMLDDVIAFKKRTAEFDHGYYRFVSHPRLRRLEEALKARFGCRHCKLTESLETALLELILCLRKPGTVSRILIMKEEGAAPPFSDECFLPECERKGVSVMVRDCKSEIPTDLGRDDILLVSGGFSGAAKAADSAQGQGAAVVVVLKSTGGELPTRPDVPGARFYVLGLNASVGNAQNGVRAGAVLGNADRVMARLAEQVKRRGAILSSRVADCFLGANSTQAALDPAAPHRIAEALCRLEGGTNAFLYCSGMSAITRVLDILRRRGRSHIIAVGHLYSDTYQTLRLGANRFLGVDEVDALDGLVTEDTAAILTETITNPLSDVPDLEVLSRVARAHGVPLVVDNTIATPANCHPFDFGADYVIHSTTKYLNGRNDHGGGVVIVREPLLARQLSDSQSLLNDEMSPLEASALEKNLGSFPERMCRFNENAVNVASFLARHPGVARVFFNNIPSHRSFATARRLLKGPGSVISFTLMRNTWEGLRAFYDSRLHGIVKAPSLGSDVTLLCPYTLLTHFDDTDEELAEIGLPRFLVRISVGCERDISAVIESLDTALLTYR